MWDWIKHIVWKLYRWYRPGKPLPPSDHLYLLTRETVIIECIELARMKIAGVLKVPLESVTAKVSVRKGRVSPEFQVGMGDAVGVTEDQIREVVGSVYRWVKAEMGQRMEGLRYYRYDKKNRIEAAKAEATR